MSGTIGQEFALEAPLQASLPTDEFDSTLTTTPQADSYARGAADRANARGRGVSPDVVGPQPRRSSRRHQRGDQPCPEWASPGT